MKSLKRASLALFKAYWPLLTLLLLVIIFFWRFFFLDQIPIPGDILLRVYKPWLDYHWGPVALKNPILTDVVSFTYPMQTYAISQLLSGIWPLWNPLILAGTPLLANFQSAPFSITNPFYLVFDTNTAWSLRVISQHFLAGAFTYLLLRNWKISKAGSLIGSVLFAFSGFNLLWSQWNVHALVAAFIPLLIYLFDEFLNKGSVARGLMIAPVIAFQIFAGYPQAVLYGLGALGLFWLFQKKNMRSTITLGVFVIIGLGLAAVQILPAAELLGLSQRDVEVYPFGWAFLPFEKVITFAAPDFFGNHATFDYWGPQDYTSTTGFVGVVGLMLSVVALQLAKANRQVQFAIALLITSLLLSFPTPLSVFLWESGFLGFQAASAHRALVIFTLSIALLTGFGYDVLQKRAASTRFAFVAVGSLLSGFIFWALRGFLFEQGLPSYFNHGIPKYEVALVNLFLPIAIFLFTGAFITRLRKYRKILLVFIVVELFWFGWRFTPFTPREVVYPDTPTTDFLLSKPGEIPVRTTGSSTIPINMRMAYGIEALEGYDAVYPKQISHYLASLNNGQPSTDTLGRYAQVDTVPSRLLDIASVGHVITDKELEIENYELVFRDRSVSVYRNARALPRAFVVHNWEVGQGGNEVIAKLLDESFPADTHIILEKEVDVEMTGAPPRKVDVTRYDSNKVELRVDTEDAGLLFFSDSFYPGWKAYVDGVETEVLRANFAFRAVPLLDGSRTVVFEYKPDSFYNGLKISALSLAALIVLGIYLKRSNYA